MTSYILRRLLESALILLGITFITFVLLGQFVMLNLFVAVILENFEREIAASSGEDARVSADNIEQFSECWAELQTASAAEIEKRQRRAVEALRRARETGAAPETDACGRELRPWSGATMLYVRDPHYLRYERVQNLLMLLDPPLGLRDRASPPPP